MMIDPSALDVTPIDATGASDALPEDAQLVIATENLGNRHRRICASIDVPCAVDQVWTVLTDYNSLASFIPNLSLSRCIGKSESGTLLEQVGSQCFLNIQFCARVVLNMVEAFPHRVGFTMIEGDFKVFEGAWILEQSHDSDTSTHLTYDVTLCPPRAVPTALIERHLRRDLTQNLKAIRQQAMTLSTPA